MTPAMRFTLPVLALAALSACGPTRNAALDAARTQYAEAAADPVVLREAPVALEEARDALGRAERKWEDDADVEETDHLAYLAARRVEIAEARAQAGAARARAEALREQQSDVLLAAREREIEELRKAHRTDRGLVYTVDDVLFAFDGTSLKRGAARELDDLVRFLRQNPGREVLVEGHTDTVGADDYNARLSAARARAVEEFLVQSGVEPARIETRGYGEHHPVASNANAGGRQLNRRVEVVILRPGEVAARQPRLR